MIFKIQLVSKLIDKFVKLICLTVQSIVPSTVQKLCMINWFPKSMQLIVRYQALVG